MYLDRWNFGYFLKTLKDHSNQSKTDENLINDLFSPYIEIDKLVNKNGEEYYFTKERCSRIINNKEVFPQQIIDSIRNHLSCEEIKNAIADSIVYYLGEQNINQFLEITVNKFLDDNKPNKMEKDEITQLRSSKDTNQLIYKLFCYSILIKDSMLKIERIRGRKPDPNKCNFFFLSEKNKNKEIDKFIKKVNEIDFRIDPSHLTLIQHIILFTNFNFDDKTIHLIVKKLIEIWPSEKYFSRADKLWFDFSVCANATSEEVIKKVNKWNPIIRFEDIEKEKQIIMELFNKAKKNKDYNDIESEFDKIYHWNSYLNNKYFMEFIIKKNFLLPNIKEDINESIWRYCHYISQYYGKMSIKEQYIKYLKNIIQDNPNNKTIEDRCLALIERTEKS